MCVCVWVCGCVCGCVCCVCVCVCVCVWVGVVCGVCGVVCVGVCGCVGLCGCVWVSVLCVWCVCGVCVCGWCVGGGWTVDVSECVDGCEYGYGCFLRCEDVSEYLHIRQLVLDTNQVMCVQQQSSVIYPRYVYVDSFLCPPASVSAMTACPTRSMRTPPPLRT